MNLVKKTLLLSPLFLLSCATQTIVASGQSAQQANTSTTAAATIDSSEPVESPRSFERHFTGPLDEGLRWDKARRERALSRLRVEEQEIKNKCNWTALFSALRSSEQMEEYIDSRMSLTFNRFRQREMQKIIDVTTRSLEEELKRQLEEKNNQVSTGLNASR